MMDDPLLNNHDTVRREPRRPVRSRPEVSGATHRAKRRPPARSAKILAAGLSTTAMLGMTTGYAFAGVIQDKNQTTTIPPVPTVPTMQQPTAQSTPTAPPPGSIAPATPSPATETVIDVPIPGAQPGGGSSNWNNQQSSGSN